MVSRETVAQRRQDVENFLSFDAALLLSNCILYFSGFLTCHLPTIEGWDPLTRF